MSTGTDLRTDSTLNPLEEGSTASCRTQDDCRFLGAEGRSVVSPTSRDCAGFRRRSRNAQSGFSLLELVVVLGITGIMIGIVSFDFKAIENEAYNGASELMGFMKRARAKALTSTVSYTIYPSSSTMIVASYSDSCSGVQTSDPSLFLELPSGAHLTDTSWSICYSSRGLSDSSADVVIQDSTRSATVQVVLGGGVRIL